MCNFVISVANRKDGNKKLQDQEKNTKKQDTENFGPKIDFQEYT